MIIAERMDFLATIPATPVYPKVNLSKTLLKPLKNFCNPLFDSFFGFNSKAQSAGLSVKALNAEKMLG